MSAPKHTPGPWRVVRVLLPGEQSDVPGVVSESGVCLSSQVTMANAHLIAAAPELLEAAQAALFALGRLGGNAAGGPNREEWEKLAQAIAKAEGREL